MYIFRAQYEMTKHTFANKISPSHRHPNLFAQIYRDMFSPFQPLWPLAEHLIQFQVLTENFDQSVQYTQYTQYTLHTTHTYIMIRPMCFWCGCLMKKNNRNELRKINLCVRFIVIVVLVFGDVCYHIDTLEHQPAYMYGDVNGIFTSITMLFLYGFNVIFNSHINRLAL